MRVAAILAAMVGIAFVFATSSRMAYAATATQSSTITAPTKKTKKTRKTITVKPGDYLYKLAKMYSTTVHRLFAANTQITNPNLIYPGEELVLPSADAQLTPRSWPDDAPAAKPTAIPPQSSDSNAAAPATTAAPMPTPRTTAVSMASSDVWDSLAQCESSGDWSTNTGNGFYGGLQFTLESWQTVGGTGYPNEASPAEQIAMAERLHAIQGWNAWPACSAKLGL